MKHSMLFIFTIAIFSSFNLFSQNQHNLTDVGISFSSKLTLKKLSESAATKYTPKMITYDGLSANGQPYFSVSLNVEFYPATKTKKALEEMIKVMLSPKMTTVVKNGITFFVDNRIETGKADTYYLQFVVNSVKYSFTISGKTGTKEEMESIMQSIKLLN